MKKVFAGLFLLAVCFPAGGATSGRDRLESWVKHVGLKETSDFKDLKWKALGPKSQGGRIESIECPAPGSSTIYVGVGAGNLWKSVNNGTTWEPIFENESTFAIGDVSIAPADSNIVWVGTGEVLLYLISRASRRTVKKRNDAVQREASITKECAQRTVSCCD